MARVATIGVFGFSAPTFLGALSGADVRVIFDIRRRRGVRGTEYAWANARRLQPALEDAGIAYRHHLELAPTTELLRLQHGEDARRRESPRSRGALAPAFRERYRAEVLERADLGPLLAHIPERGTAALLCVERDPAACHRSLVAERLSAEHGIAVAHLRP